MRYILKIKQNLLRQVTVLIVYSIINKYKSEYVVHSNSENVSKIIRKFRYYL